MDCAVCKSNSIKLTNNGVPTNMVCELCLEGAQEMIDLINDLEIENGNANSCKSLFDAWTRVVGLRKKLSFLYGLVDAYRNRTPFDILLKPDNNGSPIGAHKALLAARSNIFKNMLESDTCKAPPSETMALPELNHEELKALLEFLYCGSLPQQKLEKHIYPLSLAAHKYEIIYLQEFCKNYMLKFLHSRNALLILEISDFCSFQMVKNNALSFIVNQGRDVVFSAEYETFAAKNPHLSVEISRALLKKA